MKKRLKIKLFFAVMLLLLGLFLTTNEANAKITDQQPLTLTAKFPTNKSIDPDTVTFIANIDGEWEIIPTTKKGDKAIAEIKDPNKYKNKEGKIITGLFATKCDSCKETTFTKAYDGGSRDAIILVHDIITSPMSYDKLITLFKITKQPFQIWTFGYPSKSNYNKITKALNNYLEQNAKNFNKIKIVAHGTGGLIVQDALRNAYDQNKDYINKVKQVILIGTPNLGAKIDWKNLQKELLNSNKATRILGINPELIEITRQGKTIPKVPGIEYDVIAGTKPYKKHKAAILKPNDGIVTTESAQTVGGEKIEHFCKNYFETELTHTELLSESPAWRITARLLTREYHKENPNKVWLGYNNFIVITDAQSNKTYNLILKKIDETQTQAPLLCNCGNNVCGEGETPENCPADCAVTLFKPQNRCQLIQLLIILLTTAAILLLVTKKANTMFFATMTAGLFAIILAKITCEKWPRALITIWGATLLAKLLTKPKRKLPAKLEFNIKLAEADEKILKGQSIHKTYNELLDIYNQLEEEKKYGYKALLKLATLEEIPKKQETIKSMENTIERLSKMELTDKQKGIVRHRLGHLKKYSEKIKELLEKLK